MDETTSDELLVHLARSGDDRAFEVLYARYAPRIGAYIRGMVHDHAAAEDITQEVFFNALRRMRDTDRSIAFRPWIYEIAKNACIDSYRRTSRTKEISYDAEEGMAPADRGKLVSAGGAAEVAEVHQSLDHLQGAFGALSATHADVIVMRELEGLSYREIGERMGMSRPSVESTLFRARRRLEHEYEELITGERCKQVQSLLETGPRTRLRVTERRRMNRHLAWCQPCRVQARMAGVEVDTTKVPLRKKLGGLLPIPAFLRDRLMGAASAVLPGISGMGDPFAEWGRAAVAAAVVAVAGIGVGAATHDGQAFGAQVPGGFTPHVASSTRPPSASRVGTTGATVRPASSTGAAGAAGATGAGSPGGSQPATLPSSRSTTGGSGPSSSSRPSGSGTRAGGQVPGLPAGTGSVVGSVRGAAGTTGGAVRGATGAVGGAVRGTTTTAAGAVGGATGAVGGAVQGTTRTAAGAVQGPTRTAAGAVQGAARTTAGAVQGAAGTAGGAVRDTTSTAGNAVSGVTRTVDKAAREVAASGGSPKKVTQAVGGAVQGTTQTAGKAVPDVTTTAGNAVTRTTTTTTKAVQGTTTTAANAAQGVTQTAGSTVQRTTTTAAKTAPVPATPAGPAVQKTTEAVSGVLGGKR